MDQLAALRTILAAEGVAEGRVRAGRLLDSDVANDVLPLCLLKWGGGAQSLAQGTMKVQDVRIDIWSYGDTPAEASAVHWHAHRILDAIRHRQVDDLKVIWTKSGGGPLARTDPDTNWPMIHASRQVYSTVPTSLSS